jgi:hypothetical protein
MAIVCGATYVARAFSGKQKHMVEMFKGAIQHKGFALVDVFSPCVTYNKDNTYQWFNLRVKILEEQGHDPTDLHKVRDQVFFSWNNDGGWDFFNVRYKSGGGDKQVENRSGHYHFNGVKPNRIYTISVQGCNSHTLGRSTCSPWEQASVTTH